MKFILISSYIVRALIAFACGIAMAVAADTASPDGKTCYLFTYFTGNGEDGLHLAWSHDGYKWEKLNEGRSYLQPQVGESKLMRDPCVARGPDGIFRLVWTTSWNGKTIGYASSPDMIHWSEERAIPVMANEPGALNCWAPEVVYDAAKQDYVLYWSTTIKGRFSETLGTADHEYNHRFYVTTTKDFTNFTPTHLLYDPDFVCIDATFLRAGNQLYLVFKDETLKPVRKNLRMAAAASYEGPFTDLSPAFTGHWVEGPTALRVGEDYMVYFDCYREGHYGAVRSRDLKTWEDVTARLSFVKGARHGTIIEVPSETIAHLLAAHSQ